MSLSASGSTGKCHCTDRYARQVLISATLNIPMLIAFAKERQSRLFGDCSTMPAPDNAGAIVGAKLNIKEEWSFWERNIRQ